MRGIGLVMAGWLLATGLAPAQEYKSGIPWSEPKLVTPGTASTAPSDAIVLFGGKDLSAWNNGDKWLVADGVATAAKTGISTKEMFGDCQLHIEWATPDKVEGAGQGRGNSGVYFMGRYELQVLDSFQNPTYFDGQAGSIYKQYPPLVNASRKPGEWQIYDVIFTAPRFDSSGKLLSPAYITALHNGVLIQNHAELKGNTFFDRPPSYKAHPPKGTIDLQYHGNPMRFRNIWVRELKPLTVPEKKNPVAGKK